MTNKGSGLLKELMKVAITESNEETTNKVKLQDSWVGILTLVK